MAPTPPAVRKLLSLLPFPLLPTLFAMVALAWAGCAGRSPAPSLPSPSNAALAPANPGEVATPEEAQLALQELEDEFERRLASTGSSLYTWAASAKEREAALQMQVRLNAALDQAMNHPEWWTALAQTWTLQQRLADYLREGGPGEAYIGPAGQTQVSAMANDLLETTEATALSLLGVEGAQALAQQVATAAKADPMVGLFSQASATSASASRYSWANLGNEMLRAGIDLGRTPLSAVKALGQGASEALDSPSTLRRLLEVIGDLPRNFRLEMTILAEDLATNDSVTTTVLALERASFASEEAARALDRLSSATARLPEDTARLIQQLAAEQENLRATLEETRRLVEAARPVADSLALTAENLKLGATELRIMTRGEEHSSASETTYEGRPFNILEYEVTARSLATAAESLKEALQETRGLVNEHALADSLSSTGHQAEESARRLMDRLFLWMAGLIALTGSTIAGVTVLRARSGRSQSSNGP